MQNILYRQGHSGRVAVHIKLRLKWLVSAGLYSNCTTVSETTDCMYLPGLQRVFFLVQMRIHMHSPFKLELAYFEEK